MAQDYLGLMSGQAGEEDKPFLDLFMITQWLKSKYCGWWTRSWQAFNTIHSGVKCGLALATTGVAIATLVCASFAAGPYAPAVLLGLAILGTAFAGAVTTGLLTYRGFHAWNSHSEYAAYKNSIRRSNISELEKAKENALFDLAKGAGWARGWGSWVRSNMMGSTFGDYMAVKTADFIMRAFSERQYTHYRIHAVSILKVIGMSSQEVRELMGASYS